ncbi:MAG: UDP-N-acetylmuramoyl-L-alanyl-D-glutamate--2,6-diaminopimelate ligase [Holosporaceae bacterium]|jgi:UDP-N-acetylmuramoyl-L-alanyl-D-glutamate--2,6-diaminopimelate ligase|nr:UDP-N-acetylmuramoyl-L-alanyl-D-glutamate--2,6-diaminopimelate ligase [Holosporaceae bacterium]
MKKVLELFDHKDAVDLCDNSKLVTRGSMFVALNRNAEQRKNHIEEAIVRGAKYIVLEGSESYCKTENDVMFFSVKNVRAELARIASYFFPSNFDNVAVVTGTNGKSSTVDILRQIWIASGIDVASIGTLGVVEKNGCKKLSHNMTSPDCLELHKILHTLCERKIRYIAMEATSQGIEQHRVDQIKFNVCAFTNFTQDHLDYHKTLENYWNAKLRLFKELASEQSVFVANSDDQYSEKIHNVADERKIKYIDYGYNSNYIRILKIIPNESQQWVDALFFRKKISFALPLCGVFQVYNAMCAATIAYITGLSIDNIVNCLQKLQPINGRLELVAQFGSSSIYIDYAHTPDALQNAISSLRNHKKSRIITVFGCGGNRDQQKRILMGKVAEKFSDIVIVTDDNPRDEDPAQIRKMILEGCQYAIEIGDRKSAIKSAIKMLSDGDTLLVAGKGHETYQVIGKESQEFDDKKIILDEVQK